MKHLKTYGVALLILLGVWGLGSLAPILLPVIEAAPEGELLQVFFTLSLLFLLSYFVELAAKRTGLPPFVYALLFGLFTGPLLTPITHNPSLLSAIVALGATLILFGGGLEVPYKNFVRLSPKILSLSFIGLGLTAVLFSYSLQIFAPLTGATLGMEGLILLGAILASTDPAAIIPILRSLRFTNRDVKEIIISESAVTDVTGTLLTSVFLTALASGVAPTSIPGAYGLLISPASGMVLLKEILFGVVAGGAGFLILDSIHRHKKNGAREESGDIAFFIAIPVLTFFVAGVFGGSGYLAAFIAGLIMHLTEHLHETEHFFNNLIDAFLKPIIFIVLGGLVSFSELFQYAGIGILSAAIFMLVLRPLTVFISLSPWMIFGKQRMPLREALFIACVRETGAIPAVLLVTVVSSGHATEMAGILPIGLWIIIATLVLEPPLTPWLAKRLNIGECMTTANNLPVLPLPSALFASRGHSHLRRLPQVFDWAAHHGIRRLSVLLCPEDDYTPDFEETLRDSTMRLFHRLNERLRTEEGIELETQLFIQQGMLHKNIEQACNKDSSVTVLFVGKGVLDFRLGEIKNMHVPFYFLD